MQEARENHGRSPLPPSNSSARPKVGIIVVNWNGWRDTVSCIRSLKDLSHSNFLVVVVDNGSADGSVTRIKNAHPDIVVLDAGENRGFAGGNNIGMRYALEHGVDYLWLVNNDATVRQDSLTHLISMAEANPDIDFFGSWIGFEDHADELWFGGGEYRWQTGFMGHVAHGKKASHCSGRGQVHSTGWITGCSLLTRATTVQRIGLLDESYFLYREDVEWQLRTNRKAPRALLFGDVLVFHKVGRSTGTSRSRLGTVFMSRNYLRLARAYAGWALPAWLGRWLMQYIFKPVLKGNYLEAGLAIRSLLMQGLCGPAIIAKVSQGADKSSS